MNGSLDEVISKMGLSDIVRGVIILKPGRQSFREGDLKRGLEKAAERYEYLRGLFREYSSGDGTSPPERTSGFETAMQSCETTRLIYSDPAFLHLSYFHVNESGKSFHKRLLQERYDEKLFAGLQLLAEDVWLGDKK